MIHFYYKQINLKNILKAILKELFKRIYLKEFIIGHFLKMTLKEFI